MISFKEFLIESENDGSFDYEANPPKKTVKAYKLFRVHPKTGDLHPLFVNRNDPVPMGKWLSAKAGPAGKKDGKVKSSLGDLAYRPGWHSSDMPVATHIGGKTEKNLKSPNYRPSNHAWAEVEHPADKDLQSIADSNKKGNDPSTAHITDRVPHEGTYKYKTNNNAKGNWMISGGMKVNRILSDEEVHNINSKTGIHDLPRLKDLKLSNGKS